MLKPRLEKFYEKIVCEDFIILYNLKNISELPTFEGAIINSTSNKFLSNKYQLLQSFCAWFLGTSQKGVSTRARKSIALFGIRKNNLLGLKVTLRKAFLFAFLEKLLVFVLPRQLLDLKIVESVSSLQKNRLILPFINRKIATLSENLNPKLKAKKKFSKVSLNLPLISQPFKSGIRNSRRAEANNFLVYKGPEKNLIGQKETKVYFTSKNFLPNFLTISNSNASAFPEVSQLLTFFDFLPGFSFLCSFKIPQKNRFHQGGHIQKRFCSTNRIKTQLLSAFQYPVSIK